MELDYLFEIIIVLAALQSLKPTHTITTLYAGHHHNQPHPPPPQSTTPTTTTINHTHHHHNQPHPPPPQSTTPTTTTINHHPSPFFQFSQVFYLRRHQHHTNLCTHLGGGVHVVVMCMQCAFGGGVLVVCVW